LNAASKEVKRADVNLGRSGNAEFCRLLDREYDRCEVGCGFGLPKRVFRRKTA